MSGINTDQDICPSPFSSESSTLHDSTTNNAPVSSIAAIGDSVSENSEMRRFQERQPKSFPLQNPPPPPGYVCTHPPDIVFFQEPNKDEIDFELLKRLGVFDMPDLSRYIDMQLNYNLDDDDKEPPIKDKKKNEQLIIVDSSEEDDEEFMPAHKKKKFDFPILKNEAILATTSSGSNENPREFEGKVLKTEESNCAGPSAAVE